MKFSYTTKSVAVAGCLMAFAASLTATSNEAKAGVVIDMVVAEMAEGDVSSICQGGAASIAEAAREAVTALAQEGEISGDFEAIGKEAGMAFYKSKCS
ncbi:MAG: hypothetical protein HOA08_23840 [Rhodospirillaceae bacterium]|jgi:hypothetical protein|nr:hypothetical protein [Rhodospirillaceae bacterium]MBT3494951.1 hypothetical protein [Rhodospirillaceae bacterium]MBT3780625.1 hypothetical protein [Rhodospirillaceae bacterium]MBT3975737.1 hypothetical protein [Rhodospirillaceae bacterium]MBT4167436.1 hypothetical protein [Rhodospirillaceae bacterium]